MKTAIGSIGILVKLTDENSHSLSKRKANELVDEKMKEVEEMLKDQLGNKGYTSIEVESILEGDDFAQLRRTIVATAYLENAASILP